MRHAHLWTHPETGDIPEPASKPLRDPREIEKSIILNLRSSWIYRKTEKIKHSDPFLESGMLHRVFLLSDCRVWCGYLKGEQFVDNLVLEVLDDLTALGKLKIFSLGLDRFMDRYDMKFHSEVGVCQKTFKSFKRQAGSRYLSMRLYVDKPLKTQEFDEFNLTGISKRVAAIRQAQDEYLAARRGKSGLAVEAELHRQDVIADIDFKNKLAGIIEKKAKNANKKRT